MVGGVRWNLVVPFRDHKVVHMFSSVSSEMDLTGKVAATVAQLSLTIQMIRRKLQSAIVRVLRGLRQPMHHPVIRAVMVVSSKQD